MRISANIQQIVANIKTLKGNYLVAALKDISIDTLIELYDSNGLTITSTKGDGLCLFYAMALELDTALTRARVAPYNSAAIADTYVKYATKELVESAERYITESTNAVQFASNYEPESNMVVNDVLYPVNTPPRSMTMDEINAARRDAILLRGEFGGSGEIGAIARVTNKRSVILAVRNGKLQGITYIVPSNPAITLNDLTYTDLFDPKNILLLLSENSHYSAILTKSRYKEFTNIPVTSEEYIQYYIENTDKLITKQDAVQLYKTITHTTSMTDATTDAEKWMLYNTYLTDAINYKAMAYDPDTKAYNVLVPNIYDPTVRPNTQIMDIVKNQLTNAQKSIDADYAKTTLRNQQENTIRNALKVKKDNQYAIIQDTIRKQKNAYIDTFKTFIMNHKNEINQVYKSVLGYFEVGISTSVINKKASPKSMSCLMPV